MVIGVLVSIPTTTPTKGFPADPVAWQITPFVPSSLLPEAVPTATPTASATSARFHRYFRFFFMTPTLVFEPFARHRRWILRASFGIATVEMLRGQAI